MVLQGQPLHMLQQIIDEVDGRRVGQLIGLVLGLGGNRLGQRASSPSSVTSG